jgi:hypothetical protein
MLHHHRRQQTILAFTAIAAVTLLSAARTEGTETATRTPFDNQHQTPRDSNPWASGNT